jgi:hypothetical protein
MLEPDVVVRHFTTRSSSLAVASALMGALGAPRAVVHAQSGHAVGATHELAAPARQKLLRGGARARLAIERAASSVAAELDELERSGAGSAAVAWPQEWARADAAERARLVEHFKWRQSALADRIAARARAEREKAARAERAERERAELAAAELDRLRAAHAASVARGLERFAQSQ